jgi:predicted aspartyl protease
MLSRSFLVILLILPGDFFAISGAQAQQPKFTSVLKTGPVEVPMRFRGPQPAVEVFVNGQGPFLFAIDTGGAGEARLDATLAKKLNLASVGKVIAGAGSRGKAQSFEQVRLTSLKLGDAEFRDVTAMVRSYNSPGSNVPKIDGILGFGLFADYLLTLDYPGKHVRIEQGVLAKTKSENVISFDKSKGIPIADLTVDQVTIKASLDTGSMGGILLPKSVAQKLQLAETPKITGRGKTVSGEFVIEEAPLRGTVRLGTEKLLNPVVQFAEVFERANVGSKVFADFSLTFDQANQLVRFVRKEPAR